MSPSAMLLDLLALAVAGGGGAVLASVTLTPENGLSAWQRWRHARRWRRRSTLG